MGLNKLDKSICKGGKFNGREILGIRFNKKNIYETTGPSYLNIYTIQIPSRTEVQVAVYDHDNATGRNSSNYRPTIYWGDGTSIKDDNTGKTLFTKNYKNSTLKDSTIEIKTTCELLTNYHGAGYLPSEYVKDIVSIRADYLSGEDLFYGYSGVKTIKELLLQRLNTSIFNNMGGMFAYCYSLETLNLSSFNTSSVTEMSSMFYNCQALTSLDLSNFDTGNVTNMTDMFYNCTSLHTLRLDNCDNTTISNIINELPTNPIGGVTRTIYCKEENAGDLTEPANWKFSFNLEEEPEIPLYQPGQFTGDTKIETVETMVDSSHTDLSNMFSGCSSLVSVNTNDWIVDSVTVMHNAFNGCSSLTSLDLSNWNVSNVQNMNQMFYNCTNLEELNISGWDVKSTLYVHGLFKYCYSLRIIKMDNCNYTTINRLISSNTGLPSDDIGKPRIIRCKSTDAAGLEPPTGWTFEYVD